MATFSGLLGLDIEDLQFVEQPPEFQAADYELVFSDPKNPDDTYGVVYYGSKDSIVRQLVDSPDFAELVESLDVPNDTTVAYWSSLVLATPERRRGFGTRLVKRVLGMLDERGVYCTVLEAMNSAAFWRKQGFIEAGVYSDNYLPIMIRYAP